MSEKVQFNNLSELEKIKLVESLVSETVESLRKSQTTAKEEKLQDNPMGDLASKAGGENLVDKIPSGAQIPDTAKGGASEEKAEKSETSEGETVAKTEEEKELEQDLKSYILKSVQEDETFRRTLMKSLLGDVEVCADIFKSLDALTFEGESDEIAAEEVVADAGNTGSDDIITPEDMGKSEDATPASVPAQTGSTNDASDLIKALTEQVKSLTGQVEDIRKQPVSRPAAVTGLTPLFKSGEGAPAGDDDKVILFSPNEKKALLDKALGMVRDATLNGTVDALPFNKNDITYFEFSNDPRSLANIL